MDGDWVELPGVVRADCAAQNVQHERNSSENLNVIFLAKCSVGFIGWNLFALKPDFRFRYEGRIGKSRNDLPEPQLGNLNTFPR